VSVFFSESDLLRDDMTCTCALCIYRCWFQTISPPVGGFSFFFLQILICIWAERRSGLDDTGVQQAKKKRRLHINAERSARYFPIAYHSKGDDNRFVEWLIIITGMYIQTGGIHPTHQLICIYLHTCKLANWHTVSDVSLGRTLTWSSSSRHQVLFPLLVLFCPTADARTSYSALSGTFFK